MIEAYRNPVEPLKAMMVTADDGYTFSGDWADADGVLFSSLEASLGAMDDDGVTEITYYAAYTTDETGGETGGASALLALMTAASGSGLAWLAVSGRKRKDQDAE